MNKIVLPFLFIIFCFSSMFSQTEAEEDSWLMDFSEELQAWENKRPAISLNYGLSNISREDVEAAFSDNIQLGVKIGYAYKRNKYADYIEKSTFNYLLLNHNSTDLAGGSSTVSDIETDNWQFGIAWSGGYGYKIGTEASITPYYASSFNWTNMGFTDQTLSENDERIKDLYDGTYRFGTGSEAGVKVHLTSLLALEAGYERSVVFERHLFMKWVGSEIIEIAANNVLDVFINEVFKSTPAAGPIVFLVLKSALGYGIYELRRGEMNWPFSSAPPILFENIKFGLTFQF